MSLRSLRVVAGAALVLMVAAPAHAQTVSIGSNPPGTLFYALASGVAKVVTDAGKVKMSVQPHSGSSHVPSVARHR